MVNDTPSNSPAPSSLPWWIKGLGGVSLFIVIVIGALIAFLPQVLNFALPRIASHWGLHIETLTLHRFNHEEIAIDQIAIQSASRPTHYQTQHKAKGYNVRFILEI